MRLPYRCWIIPYYTLACLNVDFIRYKYSQWTSTVSSPAAILRDSLFCVWFELAVAATIFVAMPSMDSIASVVVIVIPINISVIDDIFTISNCKRTNYLINFYTNLSIIEKTLSKGNYMVFISEIYLSEDITIY